MMPSIDQKCTALPENTRNFECEHLIESSSSTTKIPSSKVTGRSDNVCLDRFSRSKSRKCVDQALQKQVVTPKVTDSADSNLTRCSQSAQKALSKWRLLYTSGSLAAGAAAGASIFAIALVAGGGVSLLSGVIAISGVAVLIGAATGFFAGSRRDREDGEVAAVKDSANAWPRGESDILVLLFSLRSFDRKICSSSKALEVQARFRAQFVAEIQQLVHNSLKSTQGDSESFSCLAEVTTRLLTCRAEQAVPSYLYRVEDVIERLPENEVIAKILRDCVRENDNSTLGIKSPYDLRLHQLEAMLVGKDVPGIDLELFCRQVGIKLGEMAIFGSLMLVGGELFKKFAVSSAVTEAGVGAGMGAEARDLGNTAREALFSDKAQLRARAKKILREIKKIYDVDLKLLPAAFQERVTRIDQQIERACESADLELFQTLLKLRQGPLLSCPVRAKQLYASGKSDKFHRQLIDQIDADVERLFAKYSHMQELRALVDAIRVNSMSTNPARRVQCYFLGNRGVGKTHFVEELARVLQLPLVKIELDDKDNLTALRGNPMAQGPHMISSPNTSLVDMFGLLQLRLLQTGVQNPLVFFDEAGELMSLVSPHGIRAGADADGFLKASVASVLKNLFDQKTKHLSLGAFPDLKIGFMHPIIIFAGNKPIQEEALGSRIPTYRFADLSLAKRREIAMAQIEISTQCCDKLDELERKIVEDQSRKIFPDLFEKCEAMKPQPGARAGEHLASMVVSACVASLYNKKEVDRERLYKDAEKYYSEEA